MSDKRDGLYMFSSTNLFLVEKLKSHKRKSVFFMQNIKTMVYWLLRDTTTAHADKKIGSLEFTNIFAAQK